MHKPQQSGGKEMCDNSDDDFEIDAWLEYKDDEKDEHFARLVDKPEPSPAEQLSGLVFSILGPKS